MTKICSQSDNAHTEYSSVQKAVCGRLHQLQFVEQYSHVVVFRAIQATRCLLSTGVGRRAGELTPPLGLIHRPPRRSVQPVGHPRGRKQQQAIKSNIQLSPSACATFLQRLGNSRVPTTAEFEICDLNSMDKKDTFKLITFLFDRAAVFFI